MYLRILIRFLLRGSHIGRFPDKSFRRGYHARHAGTDRRVTELVRGPLSAEGASAAHYIAIPADRGVAPSVRAADPVAVRVVDVELVAVVARILLLNVDAGSPGAVRATSLDDIAGGHRSDLPRRLAGVVVRFKGELEGAKRRWWGSVPECEGEFLLAVELAAIAELSARGR